MDEIKETVVQVLDKQGVLATLKAQLRACVFAVVDGQEGNGYSTDLEKRADNQRKAKVASSAEGSLLIALVREFLSWTNMQYALKVYEAEAGLTKEPTARDQLCHQMGIDHSSEEPVLLSILHKHMAHTDALSSPRISAKSRSGIAAKPGGHTVNISASAMQAPPRQPADVIKATHYPTPPSVPAAAAAAAAMHAEAQHQKHSQSAGPAGQAGSSSPHSMSPTTSHAPPLTGVAPPGETPQVSPRQAAASKAASEAARLQPAVGRSPGANGQGVVSAVSHNEVPMIRQVAAESSAPSSLSEASVISEDMSFEEEDDGQAESHIQANAPLTTAAVQAHVSQHSPSALQGLGVSSRQQQSAELQSPGSSVSPSHPALSLAVPADVNRKVFTEQNADASPIRVAIPTEVNRKTFPESPGGLTSPGDNSTEYEPDSVSASSRSSPSQQQKQDAAHSSSNSSPTSSLSPIHDRRRDGAAPSKASPTSLSPTRLNPRLPPLAPLQASPSRRSAEQIRKDLKEQDNWFDDLDESADDSEASPVAAPQTWKVHQGLAADDSQFGAASHGIMNAAFGDGSDVHDAHLPRRQYDSKRVEADIPDEF